MFRQVCFTLLVALFCIPNISSASVVVDQENYRVVGDHYSSSIQGGNDYQQLITVGVTGQLMGIDFWTFSPGTSTINPTTVRIGSGNAGQAITPLELLYDKSFTFASPTGLQHIDLSAFNIQFNAGDDFVFELIGTRTLSPRGATLTSSVSIAYTGYNPLRNGEGISDIYTDGSAWRKNGAGWLHDIGGITTADLQFRTYMLVADPPAVPTVANPEPGTMLLMGIGVVGAVILKRRKARIQV